MKDILKFDFYYYSIIKLYLLKKLLIIIILILIFNTKKINNYFNYNFNNFSHKPFKRKIKIGIVTKSIKNGGIERSTSLILNHFTKIKIFKLFLFTFKRKQKEDYVIDSKIKRIIFKNKNMTKLIKQNKIDILIYQLYNYREINELNKIKNLKLVVINNSCFLFWLYIKKYKFFRTYYKAYKNCDYTISLVPFENDYRFTN